MKQFLLFSHSQNRVIHWADTLDDALELQRMIECHPEAGVIVIFQLVTKTSETWRN